MHTLKMYNKFFVPKITTSYKLLRGTKLHDNLLTINEIVKLPRERNRQTESERKNEMGGSVQMRDRKTVKGRERYSLENA